ncbi:MAG: hypothetical protein KJ792_03020 [Actinobacteria bacterium]|nr:hypothetical protein [Actinomycetota bacterium]MCG2801459.1 hypothetical protein [Cellulomonas sp.]
MVTRDTMIAKSGLASLKVVTAGSAPGEGLALTLAGVAPASPNQWAQCGLWLLPTAAVMTVVLEEYDGASALIGSTPVDVPGTFGGNWVRVSLMRGLSAAAAKVRVAVQTKVQTATPFRVDAVTIACTSVNPGSVTDPGQWDGDTAASPATRTAHAWTGQAHASTSTRTVRTRAPGVASEVTPTLVLTETTTRGRRVTRHDILGRPAPVITTTSQPGAFDLRTGSLTAWCEDETTALATVAVLAAPVVLLTDPDRPSEASMWLVASSVQAEETGGAVALPGGAVGRRWQVAADITEVWPDGGAW